MNRRGFFLSATALAGAGVALAACGTIGQTIDSTLASVVSDVNLVSNGVKAMLPNIAAVVGISQDVVNTVTVTADKIVGVANQLGSVLTEAAAKPLVQKIAEYVQTLAGAVAGVSGLPTIVTQIMQAIVVLVPAVLQVLGIAGVMAPKGGMSVDQARAFLGLVTSGK